MLRSGEYVQFAHDDGSEIRPYLGIIRAEGQAYRQIFEVSSLDGKEQGKRRVNGSLLAKGYEAQPKNKQRN